MILVRCETRRIHAKSSNYRLVDDISPLVNLKNLIYLDLSSNEIRDLESWANYIPAEGQSLTIIIRDNPLSEISLSTYIPAMQDNGLTVAWQSLADILK